ncbi:hypothetical protein [Sphingobium phenoxybenzoativorans]|uniref:hypothetical protein n=1 Tax=Sphingobium phenoxybenzoativorans TaxID=1592790 RepID=UPI001C0D0035|nr:hypothetical protein [Sphingobium phenoxybenzoativorans]
MSTALEGKFVSRTQADLAIERLVQEIGIERTDIFVSAEGDQNSSGSVIAGSDGETVGQAAREDGALAGQIIVSVDLQDETHAEAVKAALREFAKDMSPHFHLGVSMPAGAISGSQFNQ